jgi:hypothetical protein
MVARVPAQITTLRLHLHAAAPRRSLLLPSHPLTPCLFVALPEMGSFVFILLQIPFPATPFFSHPCKTPGVGHLSASLHLHESRVTSHKSRRFILLPPLCRLFALFSAFVSFVFNRLQPLFRKHPGWGYLYAPPFLRSLCALCASATNPNADRRRIAAPI